MTPGRLAILSVVIGVFPLAIAALGSLIAHLKGCPLNEAAAEPCYCCGIDISRLLYAMFMCFWLTIFTGGIAVLGLLASALWAFWR